MPPFNLHYSVIFIGAIVNLLVGFVWYSPALFGKPWSAFMGYSPKSLKDAQAKMGPLYGLSFVAALLMAYVHQHRLPAHLTRPHGGHLSPLGLTY